jgi:hypothetical protein
MNWCAKCGGTLLELDNQVIVKVQAEDGQLEEVHFHWECVWEARRQLAGEEEADDC